MNKYPETKMTGEELHQAYVSTPVLGRSVDFAMIAVGNAALRHAIDHGQVVAAETHAAAISAMANSAGNNCDARDMAIAEAVRLWYCRQYPDVTQRIVQPDLEQIVRGVK